MIKILITGGLGFIGKSLIERINELKLEYDIHIIDIKNIENENFSYSDKMKYEKVDITNLNEVKSYFSKNEFDGIIHLAAISRVKDAELDKKKCINTNYLGTRYIAEELIKQKKQPWFLFSSSREVYGEQEVFPVAETAEKFPLNIYGFYKLEGERIIEKNFRNYIIMRLSNVYGNNYDIKDRVIPKFIINSLIEKTLILEGGEQMIDFTFIDDTIDSILAFIEKLINSDNFKEEYNVLPGVKNEIKDVIKILEKYSENKISIKVNPKRNYDVEKFWGNNEKLQKLLGNKKFISLEEGIVKTLKLYKENLEEFN